MNCFNDYRDKELEIDLIDRLALHERMKNMYSPPLWKLDRQEYEENNSRDLLCFEIDGKKYTWKQLTICYPANVCYKNVITVDGKKKNITVIKNLLREKGIK